MPNAAVTNIPNDPGSGTDAAVGVAGADGMGRGLDGMGHVLGSAHPLRPGRRTAGVRGTGGSGAITGRVTADRAHGGSAACRLKGGLAASVEA